MASCRLTKSAQEPTIIDSTQRGGLTLIATKPTLAATDRWRVLPALYGEFFGRYVCYIVGVRGGNQAKLAV
jgi:hypothetical protein